MWSRVFEVIGVLCVIVGSVGRCVQVHLGNYRQLSGINNNGESIMLKGKET